MRCFVLNNEAGIEAEIGICSVEAPSLAAQLDVLRPFRPSLGRT
jgi:hypothetical protein